MIAMQYRIILPADYPMEKIETRIREKGYLLDGYPGLLFKAYLYARKHDVYEAKTNASVNSYAPFYVWKDHHAMVAFLNSDGFHALCEQFGRPEVKMWFIEDEPDIPDAAAAFACIHHRSDQDADIDGRNYTSWETLGVVWLEESELSENKMSGDFYRIGYIAHGE